MFNLQVGQKVTIIRKNTDMKPYAVTTVSKVNSVNFQAASTIQGKKWNFDQKDNFGFYPGFGDARNLLLREFQDGDEELAVETQAKAAERKAEFQRKVEEEFVSPDAQALMEECWEVNKWGWAERQEVSTPSGELILVRALDRKLGKHTTLLVNFWEEEKANGFMEWVASAATFDGKSISSNGVGIARGSTQHNVIAQIFFMQW